MQITVEIDGELHDYRITDPIPSQLDGYAWPTDTAKAVTAADAAYLRAIEAHSAWQDAHDHLTLAPRLDDDTLRAALKAGKPDPGTPATDAAKRAEHVAWVAFTVAREESEPVLQEGKSAVAEYLRTHAADLAAYELDRLADYRAEHIKFTAARIAAESALQQVGNATRIMSAFTATRWTDSQEVALTWQADDRRWSNYHLANDQLEAKWRALAATGTKPPPIPIQEQTADQLGTDAAYGNTEARAELKRRRIASKTATV